MSVAIRAGLFAQMRDSIVYAKGWAATGRGAGPGSPPTAEHGEIAVEKQRHHVDDALDLRRLAASGLRGFVDRRLHRRNIVRLQVMAAEARHLAVAEPAREPQHPRTVRADPRPMSCAGGGPPFAPSTV